MSLVSMGFVLFLAALGQSLVPGPALLGSAKVPLITAAVVYYALMHGRASALVAAFAGGLLHDAMTFIPLGFSSFYYCALALAILAMKEYLFRESAWTAAVLTAAGAAIMALVLAVGLGGGEDPVMRVSAGPVALRVAGAAVLALPGAPVVFAVALGLDRITGHVRTREA